MSYDKKYSEEKNPEEYWKKKASLIDWYKISRKFFTRIKKIILFGLREENLIHVTIV